MNDAHKIGLEHGNPVPVTDFAWDEIDVHEQEARIRNLAADKTHFKIRLEQVIQSVRDCILAGNPSPERAGRRAYYFAQLVSKVPPFQSQAKLAKHLGITPGRVSQELNAFLGENPLIRSISQPRLNASRSCE